MLYYIIMIDLVTFSSGVARGVAGVAEATPIFEVLFNKFGQKIWVKKKIIFTAGYTNPKILPTSLTFSTNAIKTK